MAAGVPEDATSVITELQAHGATINDPESVKRVLAEHGQEIRLGALKSAMGEVAITNAQGSIRPIVKAVKSHFGH
ncbi:MAG: hypothetical protein H8E30_04525 [Alphaproteobacteria bacterium]|nr:hypothetical protein [Alphaproteobacteria bacterium]